MLSPCTNVCHVKSIFNQRPYSLTAGNNTDMVKYLVLITGHSANHVAKNQSHDYTLFNLSLLATDLISGGFSPLLPLCIYGRH